MRKNLFIFGLFTLQTSLHCVFPCPPGYRVLVNFRNVYVKSVSTIWKFLFLFFYTSIFSIYEFVRPKSEFLKHFCLQYLIQHFNWQSAGEALRQLNPYGYVLEIVSLTTPMISTYVFSMLSHKILITPNNINNNK